MSFDNGGYYNYANHLYNAGQTTGIRTVKVQVDEPEAEANSSFFTLRPSLSEWYTIDGRKLAGKPTQKGVYINKGKKQVVD